ncbi:hypothetical protein Lal_00037327 [Lupinus albus]|nr:hypothetical protein Lal_00037327 [Lupinus albus]
MTTIVFLTLRTASAASVAATVYLVHNDNQDSNWLAIFNQFGDFYVQSSGAVMSSLVVVVIFLFLIVVCFRS